MRLRLPISLRKSLLTYLVATAALSVSSGSVWAATESMPQNLVFEGGILTWNTDTANKSFHNAEGEASSFETGDSVTFASNTAVLLGEDISARQINIASGADVVIELDDNGLNFDTLSMLGGSLDMGASLNIESGKTLAVGTNDSVIKSDLTLESGARLTVDYSNSGSATSLNNSPLSLQGGSLLLLSSCGNRNGKTYDLFTNVSALKDAEGNTFILNLSNSAASNYFNASLPGTGFWAEATMQLTDNGVLQLVLHDNDVKESSTITTRQEHESNYQYYSTISFNNITSNSHFSYGGAIYGSAIMLSHNGSVDFFDNSASYGGAIYGNSITLNNNGSIKFVENTAHNYASGGAIYGNGDIILNDNQNIDFLDNLAKSSDYHQAYGGAICGWYNKKVILDNNAQVTFSKNTTSSALVFGGAICGYNGCSISLINNRIVEFSENSALASYINHNFPSFKALGGAIYGSGDVVLNNNVIVEFKANRASAVFGDINYNALGGAIFVQGNLCIQNNGFVLFEKNSEIENDSYRLRSIYATGNGNVITLSEANKGCIEFRDSVYISSGSTVKLNSDYTDDEGKIYKQTGDIIFTGAYVESHLNEILANDNVGRKATEEEITNSRTSEIHGAVSLYGGTLKIVEGAALKTRAGISVVEGGNGSIMVSDAELDAGSKNINVGTSGTLELRNGATVRAANINIAKNATFAVIKTPESELEPLGAATFSLREAAKVSETVQPCIVDGNLTLDAGSTLVLDGSYFSMSEGSILTFHAITSEGKINLVLTLGAEYGEDAQVQLFSDADVVRFVKDGQEFNSSETLLASTFFTGAWVNDKTTLSFDRNTGAIVVQNLNTVIIPEPTSATLSLLALTVLCYRRRRK